MERAAAYTLQHKALLHDALMAGLAFDVADVPCVFTAVVVPSAAALPTQASQPMPQVTPQPHLVAPLPAGVAVPQAVPVLVAPCRVWQSGEAGGVVVVLGGATPPQGAALNLLKNMLRAVGLTETPLGFVGMDGDAPKGGLQAELLAAAAPLAGAYTLVMGQGVLAALSGKALGVEGWQAAPQSLGLSGALGVTYPLELLMNKPLFKGLAWQHLQRWKAGWA